MAEERRRGEGAGDVPVFAVPAVKPKEPDATSDRTAAALRDGLAAKEVAESLLHDCGFSAIESPGKIATGVQTTFRAVDGRGRAWLFDVWGGFTTTPPRALPHRRPVACTRPGRVVHELDRRPLVLLATDLPLGTARATRPCAS